jgi:DNA repair protein RadC
MNNKISTKHRERLRNKFLKTGLEAFHDYEVIELLLTLSHSRVDCKPIAKQIINRFKTIRGVLSAPEDELASIEGVGPISIFTIKLISQLAQELLKEGAVNKPYCRSSTEVFNYLYISMRDLSKEVFKVLFLNVQNQILAIENLFEGTLTASVVYPREVVRKAIEHNAASLIFAHNHPSGNPDPSIDDKHITRDLVLSSCIMQIKVLDHVIIGDNKYFSFADSGLIDRYQKDYLQIRRDLDT